MEKVDDVLTIDVPWPPSINRYWRVWKNRIIISKEGKDYKAHMRKFLHLQLMKETLPLFPQPAKLECQIIAYPPDLRKRDSDNISKVLLDSLNKIIWDDDVQLYRIIVEKVYSEEKGYCLVKVKEID